MTDQNGEEATDATHRTPAYSQARCILFYSCGHVLACTRCAAPLTHCPTCRAPIAQKIRAFL